MFLFITLCDFLKPKRIKKIWHPLSEENILTAAFWSVFQRTKHDPSSLLKPSVNIPKTYVTVQG